MQCSRSSSLRMPPRLISRTPRVGRSSRPMQGVRRLELTRASVLDEDGQVRMPYMIMKLLAKQKHSEPRPAAVSSCFKLQHSFLACLVTLGTTDASPYPRPVALSFGCLLPSAKHSPPSMLYRHCTAVIIAHRLAGCTGQGDTAYTRYLQVRCWPNSRCHLLRGACGLVVCEGGVQVG